MKEVLFTKYSNERDPRFAIRTSIIEDSKKNKRYVEKTAVTKEAEGHVQNMLVAYEKLSEYYKGTDVQFSKCKIKNGVAVFDYIDGNSLGDKFEKLVENEDYKGILELYKSFEDIVKKGSGLKPFVMTEKFKEVFGDITLPDGLMAREYSNIDLIFENIILGDKYTIIDYEWSLDFPVPIEYIMFRSVFTFMYVKNHNSLIQRDLFSFLGFSEKEREIYMKMEENFQKYVTINAHPLSYVYDKIRGNNYDLSSAIEKINQENADLCLTQVYYDLGNGYSEENSYKQFYNYNQDINFTISVDEKVKNYRFDPTCVFSLVNIKKCIGVKNGGIYDLEFKTNGYRNKNTIVFDTVDPQINFENFEENTEKIEIVYNVMPLTERTVNDYARAICDKISAEDKYSEQISYVNKLESEKNHLTGLNKDLKDKNVILEVSKAELEKHNKEMQNENENLNRKINLLESSYDALKRNADAMNNNINGLNGEIESLRIQLNNVNNDYNAVLNSRIWKTTAGYRRSVGKLKQYIGTHKWTLQMYLVYRSLKVDGIKTTLHRVINRLKGVQNSVSMPVATNYGELRENTLDLNAIKPLETLDKTIAIHLHLYYVDLLEEFFEYFTNMPYKFDLYVSCKEGSDIKAITHKFKKLKNVGKVDVRYTINRGRDIAPLYVQFGAEIEKYDYFLHIHSKKSLHSGSEMLDWRKNSMNCLLGSPERVKKIFAMFEGDTKAGIVCPETSNVMGPIASHWLRNTAEGRKLLNRMGIPYSGGFFSYPIGSFFWAKTEALRPVFDMKLKYEDFPQEAGQIDGTVAHALERAVAFVCKHKGYNLAILDNDDNVVRINRTVKSFYSYFACRMEDVFNFLNRKEVISFDIFDTLITRLIYNPDDIFMLMERKIYNKYNLKLDYLKVRKEAEAKAVTQKGAFCNIHDIYDYMPDKKLGITKEMAEEFKEMEISLELDLCVPRRDIQKIFNMLKNAGKKILLLSDMYLTSDIIAKMLEKCGYSGWDEIWISCEKGKRKDNDEMWKLFAEKYGTRQAIHIGDNAQSDVQAPGDLRLEGIFEGFLVLNPRDEFKFSKYYNAFSKYENTTVENSIILGTLVNGYLCNNAFSSDNLGETKFDNAKDLGAGAFGALFTAFADNIYKWAGKNDLWFLAREGYVLKEVYDIFAKNITGEKVNSEYFLTSRRSVAVPAIESADDVKGILEQYYDGNLSNMLKSRLGLNVKPDFKDIHIIMPRDIEKVMKTIEPYLNDIFKKANEEKKEYMAYIDSLQYNNNPCVVDVGYSGTIQYYLSKMLNKKVKGAYLSTTPEKKPEKLGCVCYSLYPVLDLEKSKENTVFKNQLFLEAVLKAPFGQLMCFENGKPVYGEDRIIGDDVANMQKGILEYVSKVSSVLNGIGEVNIDKNLASTIFDIGLMGCWWKNGIAEIFKVTDDYCSNGEFYYDEQKKEWTVKKSEN